MATIRKRGNTWQVRIRRQGYPDESKTLPTKFDAEQWARSTEVDMDRGQFACRDKTEKNTFGDVIRRYAHDLAMKSG